MNLKELKCTALKNYSSDNGLINKFILNGKLTQIEYLLWTNNDIYIPMCDNTEKNSKNGKISIINTIKYIDLSISLAKHDLCVFRGSSFQNMNLKNIKINDMINIPVYISTSKKYNIAIDFIIDLFMIIFIKHKTPVIMLNKCSNLIYQKEIVLPKHTKIKVIHYVPCNIHKKYTLIICTTLI
jgi:hypothetical protein